MNRITCIVQRILLGFLSTCVLSIACLTISFATYQQNIARAIEYEGCANIPATPDYLRSRRPTDAIAAINHARAFEHLHPLHLPGSFYQMDATQQQFTLVNLERTDRGLHPLQMDPTLSTLALGYSRQLSHLHFFSHTSPISGTFTQRIDSNPTIAHHYSLAAENLAGNAVAGTGPIYEYMYNDGSEGCGHRSNILEPDLNLVGIGVVPNATYGSISAQEFLATQSGTDDLGVAPRAMARPLKVQIIANKHADPRSYSALVTNGNPIRVSWFVDSVRQPVEVGQSFTLKPHSLRPGRHILYVYAVNDMQEYSEAHRVIMA